MEQPSHDIRDYRRGDIVYAETIDTDTMAEGEITSAHGDQLTFVDAVGHSHTTRPELVLRHEHHGGPRESPAT